MKSSKAILVNAIVGALLSIALISGCKKEEDNNHTATCTDGIMNGTETGVDCGGSCTACAPSCPEKHAGTYKGTVTYFNGTVYSNVDASIRVQGSGSSAKMVMNYYLSPADTIYATMNCSLNTFTIPAQTVGSCDFEGYGTISANGATMTYHISNQGSGCGPVYLDGTFTKL